MMKKTVHSERVLGHLLSCPCA